MSLNSWHSFHFLNKDIDRLDVLFQGGKTLLNIYPKNVNFFYTVSALKKVSDISANDVIIFLWM